VADSAGVADQVELVPVPGLAVFFHAHDDAAGDAVGAAGEGGVPCRLEGGGVWRSSFEVMRHEPAQVAGDATGVFADAQTAGFMVDHPHPEDGMVAPKSGRGGERLIDVAFLAVVTTGFLDDHAAFDAGDVAASRL